MRRAYVAPDLHPTQFEFTCVLHLSCYKFKSMKWKAEGLYFVCDATPLVSHHRFIAVSRNVDSPWLQFSCGAGACGPSCHCCRPISVDASFPQHGPHIQEPHKLRVKPILDYGPERRILSGI